MNALRVLYLVSPSASFAGIERVVHEVADALAKNFDDLDVHVGYCSSYDEPAIDAAAYTAHILNVPRLLQMPVPVRRLIKSGRYDVVVVPQVEATVMTWLGTRGVSVGALVCHLHGNPLVEERDGTVRTRLAFVAWRRLLRSQISAVYTVSESLARKVRTVIPDQVTVTNLPNPVRDLHGEPRPPEDPFRFVCVARLSYQKGQDVLLRAFAMARTRLPNARLDLVGTGPQEQELRDLANDLDLNDSVEFSGFVKNPTEKLSGAGCFVLASRWEGFGVALVEALQFGLPLVATDCDFGPSDIITDGVVGDLVPPEDPVALAEALVAAANRDWVPEDAVRRAARAREYSPAAVAGHHREALFSTFERSGLRRAPAPSAAVVGAHEGST
ncbi:glycosyltransferase [Branchiibius sp. NY16-3462-2]|uniref:glycosyltransferase n=1 Tax=Branchiibius sp. NY16-3462-2 TaxID=1807500 RepID=UPI00079B123F|nr:glycosyltransferase [Branchiibius sp. NY16-3462-2]KYH44978.1 hypothetical protein AZH51_13855 [Branchiibius sp. NY16-3462-2]